MGADVMIHGLWLPTASDNENSDMRTVLPDFWDQSATIHLRDYEVAQDDVKI